MRDQFKNMMIGIFVTTALLIITFMIFFFHPYMGDEGTTLTVLFSDIDKVNVGTRVTFAGKPIGEVVSIQELESVREGRTAKRGDIYVYELKLSVDSSTKVFNTDTIYLRTSGLLGERSIAIDPGPLKPGEKLRMVNNEVLYAEPSSSVEETFQSLKEVANRATGVIDMVTEALGEMKEKQTWGNVATIMENFAGISDDLKNDWPKVNETIQNLAETTGSTKEIAQNVKNGEGSIGKLFAKEEVYLNITALLSKGQTILDDINHYGILFQNDKGWQRLRARRMNLLQKLCTPQEFRNFFNDELNEINTGISRVASVLDKTLCCPPYACLADNPEFQKVFAEVMRKVTSLEEALKMYNTQVMDVRVRDFELN